MDKPEVGERLFRPVHTIRRDTAPVKTILEVDWSTEGRDPVTRCMYLHELGCWTLGVGRGLVVFADSAPPDDWTHMTVTQTMNSAIRAKFEKPDKELLMSLYPGPTAETLGRAQLRRIAMRHPLQLVDILTLETVFDCLSDAKTLEIVSRVLDQRKSADAQMEIADLISLTSTLKAQAEKVFQQIQAGEDAGSGPAWMKVIQKIGAVRSDVMGLLR